MAKLKNMYIGAVCVYEKGSTNYNLALAVRPFTDRKAAMESVRFSSENDNYTGYKGKHLYTFLIRNPK